jgi:hypothetical protein
MVTEAAKKRVEEHWNDPTYPMSEAFESKEAAIEMFLEDER